MFNFTFHNPTRIVFGRGQIARLAEEIPAGARILVLIGGGSVYQNGVMQQVEQALQGRAWSVFAGIEANPQYDTLMRAVAQVREQGVDFLLAVGGGSVIDGCKFVAAAAHYGGADPWDILASGAPVTSALPFGTVLTLPATGSEMNSGSVVSRGQDKLFFGSPLVYPRFSILDPQTTFSLPARQVANGVVDSFVHIMEQYLTYDVQAVVQERLAEGLLSTLVELGPRVLQQPEDYELRANLMWCSTLALNGLLGCGVPQDWATHMLGHEVTARHGLDHAQTLAVVLPAMLQVRRESKFQRLLQYGERVWGLRDGDAQTRVDEAIARTRAFFEQMQVPTRLSSYGVQAADIDALVTSLSAHGFVRLGEHGDVTPEVARRVYEQAL